MKKKELKQVLKPIVEELVEEVIGEVLMTEGLFESKIKEAIFDGNILKEMVSQVASGLVESNYSKISEKNDTRNNVNSIYTRESIGKKYKKFGSEKVFSLDKEDFALKGQLDNKIIDNLRNSKKIGIMFEGTSPLSDNGSSAIIESTGEPNYQDPLSVAASIPNPELGGAVSEDVLFSLLGGKKYNFS